MRILISGTGIAGPTLAYWLTKYDYDVTLVERAPRLRTNGYIIDFWGVGFDVAGRMGLMPEIQRRGYKVEEVRVVDGSGRRITGFPASAFERATEGRFVSLPRGELAALIFEQIKDKVKAMFGDGIAQLEEKADKVHVTFERGGERDFDLVIGADGLHSRVRELAFGPQEKFEKYLGCKVAAFEVEGYRPRDELIYVMYTEVGQQVARFAMRGDRTMFLFTFADPAGNGEPAGNVAAQKELLRKHFGQSGWECRRILEALEASGDLYFDRVSQIQMGNEAGSWTRGRVSLVGDAAFCVSLLAGQGTSLAMAAAYVLAGELRRAQGDHATAFARYQELFAPLIRQKQTAALRMINFFAPRSRWSLFLRNQVLRMMAIPWVADLAAGRDLVDKIELPDYGQ